MEHRGFGRARQIWPKAGRKSGVVAARMKQSGMMWTLDGAKDMLQLRASVKSRRFWSDFENLLPPLPPQQTDQIHLEAA